MRRSTVIFLLLAVLAGCRENANVADFWNTHIKEFLDLLPLGGDAGVSSGNVGI